MKKPFLYLVYALTIVLIGNSCSTGRFNTTKVISQDFTQYRSYGWLPPVDSLSKDYFSNNIAKENILTVANQELEKLGLTYNKDNPDILFRYISIVNNKSRAIYHPYSGWGWGMGWYNPYWGMGWNHPIGRERFRYSHLIIEAIDRKTNTVVWQARGSSEVRNPERAINKLPKMVEGIFKKYPKR